MTPPNFCLQFIFEDKAAHAAHASSNAGGSGLRRPTGPELDGGDVAFTDYELVAAKS